LLKIVEGLTTCTRLRRFLVEHPLDTDRYDCLHILKVSLAIKLCSGTNFPCLDNRNHVIYSSGGVHHI
jgi:hypothetical protein